MNKTEAREALDLRGIEYAMSGKGSRLGDLLDLLEVATSHVPVVGPIVAAVAAIEELVVTRRERLERDHGFEFHKTGHGYGWSVYAADGTQHASHERSRHGPQRHHQSLQRALAEAERLTQ